VAYYMVCFGTSSGAPYEGTASVLGEPSPVKVGTVTSAKLDGLYKDSTYYFAIRAFDRCGNASDYSNEMMLETRFNHRPVIYSRVFNIDPGLPAGTVIDILWAHDEDRYQSLSFYLSGDNACTAFSVDSVSGVIRVLDADQLDYWITGIDSFLMHVGVRDNSPVSLSDSAAILIVLNISTGIRRAPLPHELGFRLYPNPATDELNIELSEQPGTGVLSISIINLQGQTIWNEKHREETRNKYLVDLSGIPPGFYSVVVQTEKARGVQRLVLIK